MNCACPLLNSAGQPLMSDHLWCLQLLLCMQVAVGILLAITAGLLLARTRGTGVFLLDMNCFKVPEKYALHAVCDRKCHPGLHCCCSFCALIHENTFLLLVGTIVMAVL